MVEALNDDPDAVSFQASNYYFNYMGIVPFAFLGGRDLSPISSHTL